MSSVSRFTLRLAAVWVIFMLPAAAFALGNPGFETGSFAGWATFGPGWRTSGGADANTGSFGVVDDVLATDTPGFRGVFQEVTVTPGETYRSGVWIRAVNLTGHSESWFELQFLDSSHSVLQQYQSTHVTADQSFTFMSAGDQVAPPLAAFASVRGIVMQTSAPPATEFQIFDDFVFVPEPASIGLVAVGTLAIAGWRTSRRSVR